MNQNILWIDYELTMRELKSKFALFRFSKSSDKHFKYYNKA